VADNVAFQIKDANCGSSPEALEVDHPKELQYDEYDGDDDQGVNKAASFGDSGTISRTEKPDQPQHDQNPDDNPQHELSPFRL
jgi:hypothetical protein